MQQLAGYAGLCSRVQLVSAAYMYVASCSACCSVCATCFGQLVVHVVVELVPQLVSLFSALMPLGLQRGGEIEQK